MGVNDLALADVSVVAAFHFYKKMNGPTSPTPPEMPIIGRRLTIPRGGPLNAGTGLEQKQKRLRCATAAKGLTGQHRGRVQKMRPFKPMQDCGARARHRIRVPLHRGGTGWRIATIRFYRFSASPRIT